MTFTQIYFGTEGRLGRLAYFGWTILMGAALAAVVLALFFAADITIASPQLLGLVLVWPAAALLIKRLHDMNLGGWHAAWILVLSVASGFVPEDSPLYWVATAANIGVGLWVLLAPGTLGPNEYGDRMR